MAFDKLITIQKVDEDTGSWNDMWNLHADVNYAKSSDYADAGSQRTSHSMTFRIRYFSGIKDVSHNTQLYRIIFEGDTFAIDGYDDFNLKHKVIRIKAVSFGE